MMSDEVRAIWGGPTEIIQEEPGAGSRFEVWSYGGSRSVRFDRKRRVASNNIKSVALGRIYSASNYKRAIRSYSY